MTKQFKQIAKKIHKAGFFHSLQVEGSTVSFRDCYNCLYAFHVDNYPYTGCGMFVIGRVETWQELAPTFESEYNSLGMVDRAKFIPYHMQNTDNPDYILRASLTSLGVNFNTI